MTANFAATLMEAVQRTGAPCIVGLDPRPHLLPQELSGRPPLAAVADFHRFVLDEAAGKVPAVKPQIAFFEALGPAGYELFHQTCAEARARGLLVIGDAKRGDIGSTAEAYAQALFPCCDALTVNPYLGSDGVRPFLRWCREEGRGVFILVRTSNRENEFQGLPVGDATLAEVVARQVTMWAAEEGMPRIAGYGPVGAVVGATHPEEIPRFRALLDRSWLLLPGYGAQGARAENLKGAFDGHGLGALVNSSRGITACFPPSDPNWKMSIRKAILLFRDEIREAAGM
jgi:orotidine-5'-phosphate decarboxylase